MNKIYLIPMTLGDTEIDKVIPRYVQNICKETKIFIVENIRTTRRYLKQIDKNIDIDTLTFFELNKHTNINDINSYLNKIKEGNIGIISEAGCPGIADPGADIVSIAHEKGIPVIPLVGPSSILMVVMASGFNGQSFGFNGYIPIKSNERIKRIKELESISKHHNQTQVFIEAPYRNISIFNDIIKSCAKNTLLCIGCNISAESEYIKTKTIEEWKKVDPSFMNKIPTIFAIYSR
ncbi:MAG: SAM-dependent methyltransferase [Marinifilaceae bacterium]|jgi:16S rRNA (cytidine1402-2'-O)-methyltransferase|nr:SAM-dependent methyltransferase [Marinifilaceae bacterium]